MFEILLTEKWGEKKVNVKVCFGFFFVNSLLLISSPCIAIKKIVNY